MGDAGPIRIALVDDHQVFNDAISARLDVEPDLVVVGTARSGEEAAMLLDRLRDEVDVVAVDLQLGEEDGLGIARSALARSTRIAAILVTDGDAEDRCVEAIRAGVRGWVVKTDPASVLVDAIRCVADGGTHLPARLLTDVLAALTAPGEGPATHDAVLDRLTRRELDVLRCLVDGMSRREIATLLDLSPNTVRTHVQSILRKFEVHSALTAVAVARRAGIRAE